MRPAIWVLDLFLRLHGIRWQRGHWVQNDNEVIPDFALVGVLMMFLLGGICLVMGLAYWLLTVIATARA